MILGGGFEPEQVQEAAESVVAEGGEVFTSIWDRLATGDPVTWVSFVALVVALCLIVGFFRGTITLGRWR
jgi:hypothetical protein